MPFYAGDILLKLDTGPFADTLATRHHVMLVLGESEHKNPIVMHMLAAPEWKLVREELTRGKELIQLQFGWSEEMRNEIVKAAETTHLSKNFIINKEIIQNHLRAVSKFRPQSSYDSEMKLATLNNAYLKEPSANLTLGPKEPVIMSCHQWVLAVMQYACQQTKTSVPKTLQIPPHLAWADRLYAAALQDKNVTYRTINVFGSGVEEVARIKEEKKREDSPAESVLYRFGLFSDHADYFHIPISGGLFNLKKIG